MGEMRFTPGPLTVLHLYAAAPDLYEALKAAVEIIDKWIEPETMGVVRSGDGVLGHYLRDEYLMNFRAALAKVSPQAVSENGNVQE